MNEDGKFDRKMLRIQNARKISRIFSDGRDVSSNVDAVVPEWQNEFNMFCCPLVLSFETKFYMPKFESEPYIFKTLLHENNMLATHSTLRM